MLAGRRWGRSSWSEGPGTSAEAMSRRHPRADGPRPPLRTKRANRADTVGGECSAAAGDWPLIGGVIHTIDDLHVLWPKAAATQLIQPGSLGEHSARRSIAALPSA